MSMHLCVLPLASLLLLATGPAFANSDPFDPELFLSPYGEVAAPLITTEVVIADASESGPAESPIAGLMTDGSSAEYVVDDKPTETGAPDDAAIELALQSNNFIEAEAETVALIAADLASLSETTGSVEPAGSMEVVCLEGYEDR
jgi:hypothetical protein